MNDQRPGPETPRRRTRAARNIDRPPIVAVGDIDMFFERMRTIAAPTGKVTTAWAGNFNLSRHVVPMLKWLGIIAEDGTANAELWNRVRGPGSQQATLSELVQGAYGPVFEQIEVAEADRQGLDGAFMQSYGMGDTARYVRAFISLCGHAGITVSGQEEEPTEAQPRQPRRQAPRPRREQPAARATRRSDANLAAAARVRRTQRGASQPTIGANVEILAAWSEDEIRARLRMVRAALDELDEGG